MARWEDGGTAVLDRADHSGGGPPPGPTATRTAGRTVAALIGLNLVIQVALVIAFVADHVEVATAVRISLLAGLVFYAVAALAVRLWSDSLGIHAHAGLEHGLVAAAEGVVVGAGAAALLSALLRVFFGRPLPDPLSAALAAGGVGWLLAGAAMVAVLAPLVEELVFRGFLLEAFRTRGRRSAVLISAVAFSLAHLQLAAFRYYLVMGVAFGLLYWRRGLAGSIAAHAAFNGTLVMVAVASLHAPMRQISTEGFTVAVPAAWSTAADVPDADLVATGPLGTRVELAHVDANLRLDVESIAADLAAGKVPMPDRVVVAPDSVRVVDLPAGRAVTMAAQVDDHDGRVTMVPNGHRLWVATLRGATDEDSAGRFDAIVRSLRLR